MSFLRGKLIFYMTRRTLGTTKTLQAAGWNKDWKPDVYPKTEAEKIAAAKKYGLLPEEYVPTPDDGHGTGDYPDFKPYSVSSRDPFYPWDYPGYRRNYGEPLIENFNMYGEDRCNIDEKPPLPFHKMLLWLCSVLGVSYYVLFFLLDNTAMLPFMPKHMPNEGVKHYKYPSKN